MATRTSQRVFIWIITIAMILGTVFSFAVMIIGTKNQQADDAKMKELMAQYQADTTDYQAKVEAQARKLSDKYYDTFKRYKSAPKPFASNDVKKLTTKDLKVGTGQAVNEDGTNYSAYYIGWNPKGTVFDSSFDDNALKAPLDPSGGIIEGWTKGVKGMKIGGIRQLTIPSDLAYGDQARGDDLPANTPLKFIVMAIPRVKEIPQPDIPPELLKYYGG